MMINVKEGETHSVNDIWNFDIHVFGRGLSHPSFKPKGTAYYMQTDQVQGSLAHNSFAAAQTTNDVNFKVMPNNTVCIIDFLGLKMNDERIFKVKSGSQGNLSYMDGGTNTTAVNPGRLGLPVINYVHFPAGMQQTLHTHPSHRIGLILTGHGEVELDNNKIFPLAPGDVFFMERNTLHNFMCNDGEDVTLFVFAPDSGTGPTDEVNPLKVRTYVGQQRV